MKTTILSLALAMMFAVSAAPAFANGKPGVTQFGPSYLEPGSAAQLSMDNKVWAPPYSQVMGYDSLFKSAE